MKLELKHLSSYLPHHLSIVIDDNAIRDMVGLDFDPYTLWVKYERKHNDIGGAVPINRVKPLLHPLSDLTKEIEVNGEKFIPIEEILHEINSLVVGGEKYSKEEMLIMCNNIYYSEAWITDRLTEWHFDIFGLIDAGLAIDINLKKH
jgi:hypothetical protein